MKTYSIALTEFTTVYYTINAESEEEARRKFENWMSEDGSTEQIEYDLQKAGSEWEISDTDEEREFIEHPDIEGV